MNFIPSDRHIKLCSQAHDLRYGARYLLANARNSCPDFELNSFYVYTNSRFTLIKILWLEERNICMCVRKLSMGTYRWPKSRNGGESTWVLYSREEFLAMLAKPKEYKRKSLRDLLKKALA